MANSHSKDNADQWVEELLTDIAKSTLTLRTELTFIAVPVVIYLAAVIMVNSLVAIIATGLVITLGLALSGPRRWILHKLYKSRLRRAWEEACEDAQLATKSGKLPTVKRACKIPVGDELLVRIPRGGSVSEVEQQSERIAAALNVSDVTITRCTKNAAYAKVVLVRCDPLDTVTPLNWPKLDTAQLSLWQPIPVGIDEHGETIHISLPERNVLIGGEPGAGKSAALSMLVATAALDPNTKLWLLDGKLVELAVWAPLAQQTVGTSNDDAIAVLRLLRQEMEARYEYLLANGLRKVSITDGLPLHMVVCDELAYYLTDSDRKRRTEFADLMRDLVSRGRAAGIIVIAATQKPSHDIIPTSLRDLFGFRWALRCNTPQASDTVLGTGWASQGFDAAKVPGSQRGVGYLHAEDKQPIRIRSFYLTDRDIELISKRAQGLRSIVQELSHD